MRLSKIHNRIHPLLSLVRETSYRELEGLDKQLRTIKGSLKVAIAKRVDSEGHIKLEERKLNEIQDPK